MNGPVREPSTPHQLPPGLEAWGEALAALAPEVRVGLLPMVEGLARLLSRDDTRSGSEGEPDGYGGLTNRGRVELLALSEWALAEEAPIEFLRRAAQGELLHLAPVRGRPAPTGEIAVLVDTSASQLGACRLVQLAALVVLARRAAEQGTPMRLGLLAGPPGEWVTGEAVDLLQVWRAGRAVTVPSAERVRAWVASASAADTQCWLLAGVDTGRVTPAGVRTLVLSESGWDDDGVREVTAQLGHDRAVLVMPVAKVGVAALRGGGVSARSTAVGRSGAALSVPTFHGGARRVLARGAPGELVTFPLPPSGEGSGAIRLRRHQLLGRLVAAASIGRRTIALTWHDDQLHTHVIGKSLSLKGPTTSSVPDPTALALLSEDASAPGGRAADAESMAALAVVGGLLMVHSSTGWWLLRDEVVHDPTVVAVLPGAQPLSPYVIRRTPDGFLTTQGGRLPQHGPGAQVVGGPDGSVAVSTDGAEWSVGTRAGEAPPQRIVVPRDERVIGLVGHQRLLTEAAAGVLLRVRDTEGRVRTLTGLSGGVSPARLHPSLPLLVTQPDDGTLVITDLERDQTVAVVRGETS